MEGFPPSPAPRDGAVKKGVLKPRGFNTGYGKNHLLTEIPLLPAVQSRRLESMLKGGGIGAKVSLPEQ